MEDTGKLIPLSEVHPVSDKKPTGKLYAWDAKSGDWVESGGLIFCEHQPGGRLHLIVDNDRLVGINLRDDEFSEGGGI